MLTRENSALGGATVAAIVWSLIVMRYVHPLIPLKLINLHAGMTEAQYLAAPPSPLDPLVNALITMAIGLVPTLGVLISGVLLYLVYKVHKMVGDNTSEAGSLTDQNKAILERVEKAATAAALAAVQARQANTTAQQGNTPSNSEIAAQLAAANTAIVQMLNRSALRIEENSALVREAGQKADSAYLTANAINEKLVATTASLEISQQQPGPTVEHIKETTDATLKIVQDQANEAPGGKGTP